MNFLLSSIFAERLRDAVRLEPLLPDEIRRIVGMGEKYIALSNAAIDTNVYTNMFEVEIDGVNHIIYAKISP